MDENEKLSQQAYPLADEDVEQVAGGHERPRPGGGVFLGVPHKSEGIFRGRGDLEAEEVSPLFPTK